MIPFEVCPRCGSDDVSVNRKKGTARCETCGLSASASRSGAGAASPGAPERLAPGHVPLPPGLELERLPTFLAHPFAAFCEEAHPRARLYLLADTVEVAVRWLAAVALAEVLGASGGSLPDGLAGRLRDHVERPTLGRWAAIFRALCEGRPARPLLAPGVFDLERTVVGPALEPPGEDGSGGTLDTSFLVLRNHAVHGGGLTTAHAAALVERHRERFERFVAAVAGATSGLEVLALDGERTLRLCGLAPAPVPRPASIPADAREGAYLAGAAGALPLLPIATYGPVRRIAPDGSLEARPDGPAPQLYSRTGERSLWYAPIGRDEPYAEEPGVEAFRCLFRLDREPPAGERAAAPAGGEPAGDRFAWDDFLREARVLAEDLVGRREELARLKAWLRGRDARADGVARVAWIAGAPGIGKSMLVARLAADASAARPEQQGVFYHRFRAGDARNSRRAFLRLLLAALDAWEPLRAMTATAVATGPAARDPADGARLLDDVRRRLGAVSGLAPPRPRAPAPRFVVFADGVDEVLALDPDVPSLLRDLALPGTLWVVAGRPERGLDRALEGPGCEAVFPGDGLPAMPPPDIRAMLLEGLGHAKVTLVQRDEDAGGDRVANAFVDRVVERAHGLPLYVHLLLEDLRAGALTVRDEDRLPDGLVAYFDALVERFGLSTLRRDLPLVVSLLARVAEPLDAEGLAVLLAGGPADAPAYRDRVERALRGGRALLRGVPTKAGPEGVALYHQSFREYVVGRPAEPAKGAAARPPAAALREVVDEAERLLVRSASWWSDLPAGSLRDHLFRFGTEYALWWQGPAGARAALARLLDFAYLEARVAALPGEIADLVAEYDAAARRVAPPLPEDAREDGRRLAAALGLSAHVVARTPAELGSQLAGRLGGRPALLARLRVRPARAWLRPLAPALEAPGGALLRTLGGHGSGVMAVAVTADGARAVTGSADRTVRLWDLETGLELKRLAGHSKGVLAVSVTADGRRAVSGGADGTLRVFDLEHGAALRVLEGHGDSVLAVAVTPDGRRAVSASADATLRVWDLETGAALRTLAGHESWVTAVAVTPDGRRAVSGSRDATARVFDLETGEVERTFAGHARGVAAAAVAPDGRRVVSGSFDETVKVWDLETGGELRTLVGHEGPVQGVAVTPDGRRAVSAGRDRTLRLWDLETGAALGTLVGHANVVQAIVVSPRGDRAISASFDRTARVWDLAAVGDASTDPGASAVRAVAIDAAGRRAVAGRSDGALDVLDVETGRRSARWPCHGRPIQAVALTPDGRVAVTGSLDETVKVWDLASGVELKALHGHREPVPAVALTPDGRRAISGSRDGTVRVWDLARGQSLAPIPCGAGGVWAVACLPDGRRAIAGAGDGSARLFDLETGCLLRELPGVSAVFAVAVSAEGRRALIGAGNGSVRLLDLDDGREIATLARHANRVRGVAVSPCGRRAVSASEDRTIRVFDLERGATVASFTADAAVIGCALAADGRTIVAGDESGRVHLLRLEGA